MEHSTNVIRNHRNIQILINEHSCHSSLVLAAKVVIGRPGQGDMDQHLEGTMG